MSPVFRHGGLRLYLLKLLDEAPRHGYDVIRLLQDRFMGVYSPSPGTIYPRLARLEEEGLVTHEVIDGKKVYKITDAGREELNRRFDDLADLEEELTASVRDIARELSRDVRETVRNLRDEFTWAVREAGRPPAAESPGPPEASWMPEAPADLAPDENAAERAQAEADRIQAEAERIRAEADRAQARADEARAAADRARAAAQAERDQGPGSSGAGRSGQAGSAWSEAAAEAADDHGTGAAAGVDADTPGADAGQGGQAAGETGREQRGRGWREWAEWAERRDWRDWAAWAENRDWRDWAAGQQDWKDRAKASSREWRDRARAGQAEWKERAKAGQQEWAANRARRGNTESELAVDLERLAAAFARELRGMAWQAGSLSEDAVGKLGRIFTDALNRIRAEVLRPPGAGRDEEGQ